MKQYKRNSVYIVLLLLFIVGMWGSKKEVRADFSISEPAIIYQGNADNVLNVPAKEYGSFENGVTVSEQIPTRDYYQFLGWSVNSSDTYATYQPGETINPKGTVTLYAIWKPNEYTITYDTNGGNEPVFTEKAVYGTGLAITSVIPTKSRSKFMGQAKSAESTQASYDTGKGYNENVTSDRTFYAVWSNPIYTVRYFSDGENVPVPQTKYYNEDLILTSLLPIRTGFTFVSWRTADNSITYMPGDTYTANASIELHAQWKQTTYTISYDVDGGYGGPEAQTKYYGTNITLSDKEPMIDHGQFIGWAKEKNAYRAEFFPGQIYTQDMNITLYAVWDMDQYAIDFDDKGGFYGPGSMTKTHGTALIIPSAIPEKEGYTFLGWSSKESATTPEYKAGASYTTEGKATLYAVWKKTEAAAGGNNGGNTSTGTNSGGSAGTNPGGSTATDTNNGGTGTGTNSGGNTGAGTNTGGGTGANTAQPSQPKKQTIQAVSKTVVYKSKPFYLKAKTNGGGKLTYKSSNKKVAIINSKGKITVKGYGQTTITITAAAKGNFLKTVKKITIKVVPKKQKLKSVSSPGKKKLNISWTKDKTVTGYEVQFSRRKDFKKETYKRTFKSKASSTKLVSVPNKRTYYVRIRSYKTVGKKKYYGAWSNLKQVKVK